MDMSDISNHVAKYKDAKLNFQVTYAWWILIHTVLLENDSQKGSARQATTTQNMFVTCEQLPINALVATKNTLETT